MERGQLWVSRGVCCVWVEAYAVSACCHQNASDPPPHSLTRCGAIILQGPHQLQRTNSRREEKHRSATERSASFRQQEDAANSLGWEWCCAHNMPQMLASSATDLL